MPIALTTPFPYAEGHGAPSVDYAFVLIKRLDLHAVNKRMVLFMEYGNVGAGGWEACPAREHQIDIKNTPAETAVGQNETTGAWEQEETTPEDLAFDQMRLDFLILATDVGEQIYDVLAQNLYQWLIDNGKYAGVIV